MTVALVTINLVNPVAILQDNTKQLLRQSQGKQLHRRRRTIKSYWDLLQACVMYSLRSKNNLQDSLSKRKTF